MIYNVYVYRNAINAINCKIKVNYFSEVTRVIYIYIVIYYSAYIQFFVYM